MPPVTVLALAASAGLLVVVAFLVLVPAATVRAWALVLTLAVTAVVGNNSAPRTVWVPAFALCAVVLLVAVARVGAVSDLTAPRFLVPTALWVWIGVGALLAGSYSTSRLTVYFGTAVVVALVTAHLDARGLRIVLIAVLVIAAVEVAWTAVDLVTGATPIWGQRGGVSRPNPLTGDVWERGQGSMGQPIVFGTFEAIAVVVAWSNRIGMSGAVRGVALLVAAVGVFLSGTRSAVLCAVLGVLLHAVHRRGIGRWARNVVLTAIVGGIVAVLDFGISTVTTELLSSGSWIHRSTSIAAVPRLLARPLAESLWGTGFGSETRLFADHLIETTYGLQVVDDLPVYLLGTTGVAGLAVFLAVVVVVAVRADAQGRALVLLWFGMGFSFDLLVWLQAGILLTFTFALPRLDRADGPGGGGLETVPEQAGAGPSAAVPRASGLSGRGRQEPHATPQSAGVGREQAEVVEPSESPFLQRLPWWEQGDPDHAESLAPRRLDEREQPPRVG